MRRYGMGRLGEAIAARPRLVAVLCGLITFAAAFALSDGIRFNGDLASLLKGNTSSYRTLAEIEAAFYPFSRDEVLAVEAPDLGQAEAYAELAQFVSDLQLVDGVAGVMSIFAMPAAGGGTDPFLSTATAKALAPADRIDQLLARQPLAAAMMSKDRSMTLVLVMADPDNAGGTGFSEAALAEMRALAAGAEPHLAIAFAGMGAIHRAIEKALRSDLSLLASVSTSLCVALALVLFRSWRGALIAAIPPVVGTGWFFAYAAVAGISIDAITVIIPTLLIVVGFADAVHLHFGFLRARSEGLAPREAVRAAFAGVGPACFLAALTTALACLAIGVAANAALRAFASAGFVGMFIQFAAVMLIQPLLALALGGRGAGLTPFGFAPLTRAAVATLAHARLAVAVALVLFAAFAWAQALLPSGFTLAEHLSEASGLRQLEQRLVDKGLGSGQIYVRVADADGEPGISGIDRERLAAAIRAVFPNDDPALAGSVFPSAEQIDQLEAEGQPMLRRFVSRDRLSYLLPVAVDLALPAEAIVDEVAAIRVRLDAAGLGPVIDIAGMPLLSATEVPQMISDLRLAFYVALGLVVAVIVHATGSLRLGVISLVPNLIPIVGVEAWLWLIGGQLSMTASVALTIAYGMAVDNSIHVLNRYQQGHLGGDADAIVTALGETAPPIAASTVLLVVGLAVTQVSSLPSAAIFGQMVIAALILALASSLFVLPAFVRTFARRRIP